MVDDFEILRDEGDHRSVVWYPDYDCGGVLGAGSTHIEAIYDAIAQAHALIAQLTRRLVKEQEGA